ncbi:hypothetical protein NNJEOMEG_02938 [Fundidesulfovibrio magnetotacticus]|uniref:Glycosyltransferase RgtA/B/C/D-like domain-containing protein n=1 Tax=Fundidesulfovibrio magnetotacticus TaxID=2730080 RepID=A0A6V8LTM9_9BACT|nr:glycosyltransferase family 39 protein [Fundidesulfovibrio magnetotacticus]GFK95084.1 hypothetical protein NNJEOMEG_02938 [Fundidesulfovibrio magnetotacticus]
MTADRDGRDRAAELVALGGAILVGGWLRFHHLGVPSLWWDEIIVPLMSRFPTLTILEWSATREIHPPLYHLFTKLLVWLGGSEALIRGPSALFGTASIALTHLFCARFFSWRAGVLCAALLAVNPLHILISRQGRPYAVVLFLLVCAAWKLLDYARGGRRGQLLALAGCNALAVALHYNAILFMAAQACWMWGRALLPPGRDRAVRALVHTLSLGASFAPVAWFFLLGTFTRRDVVGSNVSFLDVLCRLPRLYQDMILYFDGYVPGLEAPLLGLAVALGLVGLWRGLRENRAAATLLLAMAVVPVVVVVAGRATFLFARYIFLVHVCLLMLQGVGTAWLLRGRALPAAALALAVSVGGGAYCLERYGRHFYEPDSYNWFGPGGNYAQVADVLDPWMVPGRVFFFESEGLRQSLRWGHTRSLAASRWDAQSIVPEDSRVELGFVTSGTPAHLAQDEAGLVRRFGEPSRIDRPFGMTVYTWTVARNPVHRTDGRPVSFLFEPEPIHFVRDVYRADHVQLDPLWRGAVIPTANDQPGIIEFVVENPDNVWYYHVYVELLLANIGQGNTFDAWAVFDDAEVHLLASRGPDSRGLAKFSVFREKPFKRFTLRLRMTCTTRTPNYPGSNLEYVKFKKCLLEFRCPMRKD